MIRYTTHAIELTVKIKFKKKTFSALDNFIYKIKLNIALNMHSGCFIVKSCEGVIINGIFGTTQDSRV